MKYEGYNSEGELVSLTSEQAIEALDRNRAIINEFDKKRRDKNPNPKFKNRRKALPLFGYYGYHGI